MQLSLHALALLLALGSVHAATQCKVTIPMEGTIWKTGSLVTITWTGNTADTIPYITLAQSNGNGGYTDVAKLATEVPGGPGKFSIKLPANIVSSSDYVLLMGDSTHILCQSGQLIVQNDSGVPTIDQMSSQVDAVGTMRTANTLVPITTTLTPDFGPVPAQSAAAPTPQPPLGDGDGAAAPSLSSMSRPVNDAVETGRPTSMGSRTGTSGLLVLMSLVAIGMVAAVC